MTSSTTLARPPTLFTRGLYAVRKYWLLGFGIVVLTTVTASSLGSRVSSNVSIFETDALIVARTLEIRPDELPRAAAAVFRAGTVATTVAHNERIPYSAESLIPDHLDFEPVENTIAMRVVGRDSDREVAADLANLGAAVLVQELNRIGPGFGVFALHTRATPPTSASNNPPPLAVIGTVAGMMLAAGVIGLIMSLRKPVLDARSAAIIAGQPLFGDIVLDQDDGVGSLSNVAGLARISQALHVEPGSVRYLVSTNLAARKLSLLGCVLARFIASRGSNVILVDPTSPDAPCGGSEEQNFILRRNTLDPDADRRAPTIVIGRYSASSRVEQTRAIDPSEGSVVLVVGSGASSSRIASASAALGDRLDGVIFVHNESLSEYFRRRTVPTRA